MPAKGGKYTVVVYEDGSVYVVDGRGKVVHDVTLPEGVRRILEVRDGQLMIETQNGGRLILRVDEKGKLLPCKFLVLKSWSPGASTATGVGARTYTTPLIPVVPIPRRSVKRV